MNALPPRVATTKTISRYPMSSETCCLFTSTKTHNNNPFNILTDDDDGGDTVVASNCSPRNPPTSLPTSDLPVCPPTNRPKRQLAIQPLSLPSTLQPSSTPTCFDSFADGFVSLHRSAGCCLSTAMASSAPNGCTPHAVLKGTFGGTRGKSTQE